MTSQTQTTRAAGNGRDRLHAGSTAGEVVLAYLRDHTARLRALDAAVRRDEPDAVHQMRVTARRLRGAMQAFPALWPPGETDHLKDELKWLGQILGEARDAEVLGEYLAADLDRVPAELVLGPVKARFTVHFAPQEAAARDAVIGALDSGRYRALLGALGELLAAPPRTPAARAPARDVLPDAVARAYRRVKRRMRRARRAPEGPRRDAALHEARKAAKRARYAAEAVTPVSGKKARRLAKRMRAVQSALGDHHDAVMAQATARDIGVRAHLAGENSFSFGLLHERAHRDALESEDRAWHAWKRARRPKAVKWLG